MIDGLKCLVHCHGHDHAFASRQAVGFYNDGRALLCNIGFRGLCIREPTISSGRNIVVGTDILGEAF